MSALFVALLPLTGRAGFGCASGGSSAVAATPAPASVTRGGITYIADTPIHATVTAKFDEKAPPPQALTYAVTYDGGNGASVPGMLVIPAAVKNQGTKAPAVLLLHGLGGRKEDLALLGIALANKGYISLAIDIAGHGERPLIDGKQVIDLNLDETRTAVGQTVADLRRAVDFLATRPEVDSKRVGFVGVSLGGIIGAVFLGDDPRVQTAALWSAGGDWGKLMTTSTHPFAAKFHTTDFTVASINTRMADVDPVNDIAHFTHPLLFLYGDKDTWVPVNCIQELYQDAHDPKKQVVYPGGHIPDPFSMLSETLKWMDASLKK